MRNKATYNATLSVALGVLMLPASVSGQSMTMPLVTATSAVIDESDDQPAATRPICLKVQTFKGICRKDRRCFNSGPSIMTHLRCEQRYYPAGETPAIMHSDQCQDKVTIYTKNGAGVETATEEYRLKEGDDCLRTGSSIGPDPGLCSAETLCADLAKKQGIDPYPTDGTTVEGVP